MTCKNQRRFSSKGGNCLFLCFKQLNYFHGIYYAIFPPKYRRRFCRSGCRTSRRAGNLPPDVARTVRYSALPYILYKVYSPVICRHRPGSRGNPLNYIPEENAAVFQTRQRHFLSHLLFSLTCFPADCIFPEKSPRFASVSPSHMQSEFHSLSSEPPDLPRSSAGISSLFR